MVEGRFASACLEAVWTLQHVLYLNEVNMTQRLDEG